MNLKRPSTRTSTTNAASADLVDDGGQPSPGSSSSQVLPADRLQGVLMAIAPGGKAVFSLRGRNETPWTFIVYYDQEEARGDRGQRVPGFVSGDYEVWTSPTPEDLSTHREVLRQHVSPGKPGGLQQSYAAEQCVRAMLQRVNS